MSIFPPAGLGETIVQELRFGQLETRELIERLRVKVGQLSIQGIYKALRTLRDLNIVFLHKQQASLNARWLQQIGTFVSLAEHAYRDPKNGSGHFLQLQDGDRITYTFKNPVQVDAFWNHVLYILFEAIPRLDRWYAYASHCWFLLGRREEEVVLRNFMIRRGIRYLFTVGHRLPLDRAVAKDFDGEQAQYHMRDTPLFINRANYLGIVLNVVGDYVIEAQYDPKTTQKIEEFYKNNRMVNDAAIKALERIVEQPAKIKFTIAKNAHKARKLLQLFEKHFYFGSQKKTTPK